jgi:hypothetical protein
MELVQQIKSKLKEIKSEVKDVHPLLDQLFHKMDKIKHIEYKQGPSENGADFVLVKVDDILDTEEYIGVVVKKDAITKTAHDVTRQIDECITTPRIINGKKGIVLDEVWVITPGNITNNAQEYFLNKFRSTKIKFIDGEKLATLISKHIPQYFRGIPTVINNYLIKTKEKLANIEKNSQLTFHALSGVSIQQDLIPNDRLKYKDEDGRIRRPPSRTSMIKVLEKRSSVLIEGGMGSGKSTLLRSVASEMLETSEFEKNKRLPLYISFKSLGDNYNFNIEKLISDEIGDLHELEDEIKCVIFLDGVDESNHNLSDRISIIDRIIEYVDSQSSITLVMTSRNLDENAFKTKISHSFKSFQIAPLSLKQIIRVLEDTCKSVNIRTKIIEDLKKSAMYKKLPQTPIAAILLAKLINENERDIPSNLTELYAKYTELALGRWDIDKNINTQKEYSICNAVTKRIAKHFIEYDLMQISLNEALQFFTDYLSERNLGQNAKEVFNRLVDRCELFYIDSSNDTFGFKHRTFVEYFYALNLLDHNNVNINEESFELYWSTIFFFWIGLKKDCPNELIKFADVAPSQERTSLLKIINFGNILLAGYESTNDSIEYSIERVFTEASDFLIDIISGKIKSRLSVFSEMQLTALFRQLMSESYGYEFFSNAISLAMISVSENRELSERQKVTTLFMLDTAQASPIDDKLFDNIANSTLIGHAPLSIQLAIQHEAKDRKVHNIHIRKVQRNIKKMLSDRAAKALIKTIYERPVNKLNLK